MRTRLLIPVLAAGALGAGVVGCSTHGGLAEPALTTSASPARGRQLIEYYGCGACHVIGGISTANGHVGPPLTNFRARHPQILGLMPNTPANLVRWIMNPQKILPKGDMPDLGIGKQGAQAIAAYLYGQ
jgi:cytochrome c